MAGNGALDLSIRIMGKVDPSLTNAIGQTKKLTGSLGQALMGTKSMTSAVADAVGVIGKTGLGIMATLTASAGVMIKKTTSMAEEYQAQAADAVKYVGGIMNADGTIDPKKRAVMEDAILKMTTQVPIGRDEMAQIAAALGQSGKSYEEIFLDNEQTGEKSYLYDTARMAAAWDIEAEQAADYMAKWETAFGKTHAEIIDVADSINYLGGNMATTAAEIADVVNTSGGVGMTAGADLKTTSALGATMLAMGVDAGKAGTSLNRVFTNITLGNSVTKAQATAWNELGFDPEQLAKDMQSTGPNGEDGAASTLYNVFDAISRQDEYKQTATIKTLFGQWAIEGVSKIVNNLPALQNALLMAGDTSAYSGSMEKELLVRLDTTEAVDQMASNATDRLFINVGKQFLPIKKELTSMWIDITNEINESLPDLSNVVNGVLPLLRSILGGIGDAAQKALPWIQKGIDYTAEHGPEVAKSIASIVAAFGAMSFAPKAYGVVSSVANTVGNFALGGRSSGIPGGTLGGITVSNLLGMLSPTNLFQSAVSGGKSLWENRVSILKSAKTGAWMANSSGQGGLAGKISSAAGGVLGALNYGALTSGKKKPMQTVANKIFGVSGYINNVASIPANAVSAMVAAANPAGTATATIGNVLGAGAGAVFGKNGLNVTGGIASVVGKLGGGFMSLLGTFGPAITGVGTLIAVVSLLGDHFEDIRSIVGDVFGETGLAIFDAFAGKIGGIAERIKTAFSPEGLLNIQKSLSGKTFFGIDLDAAFGAAMPLIQSVVGVIQQIVDLGVNHIKPVLKDIISFVVDKGLPAVMPLLSMIVSVIGTTLVNAIKVVVDLVGKLLPIVEPVVLGIINLVKGIASVGVTVVNFIIRALNKLSFTVPEWVPAIGGKQFGFDLAEVPLPTFANGGFTSGPSIAGEAGMEAVISFRRSQRENNIKTWMEAGKMLGISNLAYFPTVTNAALTLRNLQNLQRFRREVELRLPIGADSDGGTSPHRTGGEYGRTYTSSSGNTYVYAPNFTVYGGMNESELQTVMEQGYERFCEYVERYEQEKRRRAYGA